MCARHLVRARPALALLFGTAVGLGHGSQAHAQCVESSAVVSESFSATTFKDSTSTVSGWPVGSAITLPTKSNFARSQSSFGFRVWAVASLGVVNNSDGVVGDDLVVLMSEPDCHLHFVRNTGAGGWNFGGASGSAGFNAQRIVTQNGAIAFGGTLKCRLEGNILKTGDFDGDGDRDIVFFANSDMQQTGTLKYAYAIRNASSAGTLSFSTYDVEDSFDEAPNAWPAGSPIFAWHHPASQVAVSDWNGDGRADVTVASSRYDSGTSTEFDEVYRFPSQAASVTQAVFAIADPYPVLGSAGLTTPLAGSSRVATSTCSGNSRGFTVLLTEDFDLDGDTDVITGSMSESRLLYFSNKGLGDPPPDPTGAGAAHPAFDNAQTITFSEGGPTYGISGDFNGDGYPDFIVGRDSKGCNGGSESGQAWLFSYDSTLSPPFRQSSVEVADRGPDIDWMVRLDINGDGRNDALIGNTVRDGRYDLLQAQATSLYARSAQAVSKIIDTVNNADYGITRVTIDANGSAGVGTTLTWYVSNDDGTTWQLVSGDPLVGAGVTHSFTSYGADLRWKVAMTGPLVTPPTAANAAVHPYASASPSITDISFTIYYVGKRRYSRSGLAQYSFDDGGTQRELIIQASFDYPTFNAYLQAFDINGLTKAGSSTGLERVDGGSGVTTFWEAGAISQADPGANNRTIYVGYAAGGTGPMDDRVELTVGNLATTTPTLQSMLGFSTVPSATAFINFLRKGMTDGAERWKLYDFGHSTPVVVAAPEGEAAFMDPAGIYNYDDFITAQSSRAPTLYIGANDGMLHAFALKREPDAPAAEVTSKGEERWAFVPKNLVGKLDNQRYTDSASTTVYRHDYYVDGAVVLTDVYDAAATEWKTVLIAGQAEGQGADGNNYYFALDVTDPDDPLPLWEFGDIPTNAGGSCDRSNPPCDYDCTRTCGVAANCAETVSCGQNSTNFFIRTNVTAEPYLEAEYYSSTASITGTHSWQSSTFRPGYVGTSYMFSDPDIGTDCSASSATTCGARIDYRFYIDTEKTYYAHLRYLTTTTDENGYGLSLNGTFLGWRNTAVTGTDWYWDNDTTISNQISLGTLAEGVYTLTVHMEEDRFRVDRIFIDDDSGPLATNDTGLTPVCEADTSFFEMSPPNVCVIPSSCTVTCDDDCVNPDTEDWPSCGAGNKCCENGDTDFCHPTGSSCDAGDTVTGETYSRPTVGLFKVDGDDRWLAWFASGYNNRGLANVGRTLYAVDAITGTKVGSWDVADLAYSGSAPTNPSTLDNTIPGGVRLVDLQGEGETGYGYVDRVYVGDLEGRMWRIDTSADAAVTSGIVTPGTGSDYTWRECNFFDAGLTSSGTDRRWAPIITRPAVAVLPVGGVFAAQVYFGTGGDDRAPDTEDYRFFAVRDDSAANTCPVSPRSEFSGDFGIARLEWVVGDGKTNEAPPRTFAAATLPADTEGDTGERYWSDPIIYNTNVVVFASLPGKIDSVNPCDTLDGVSRVFAYATRTFSADGTQFPAGASVFRDGSPFLTSDTKIRQAALIRGESNYEVNAKRSATNEGDKDLIVGGFSADASSPGLEITTDAAKIATSSTGNPLRFLRWREVSL